jgi:hypothetical protein
VVPKKGSRKVLHIPLDTQRPVDEEVYNILNGFKSSVECKNYLMSAVLYYSRSPLVLAANALIESVGKVGFGDSFANVCEKLDNILSEVKTLKALPVGPVMSSEFVSNVAVETSTATNSLLDENTKTALVSLRQKFKV